MSDIETLNIHPREVANKASKESLKKAIKMALEVENEAIRLNTQTFNNNRYTAVAKLDDYEELKNRARKIKEESIENLPALITQLTEVIEARGGKVFLAKTKEEASSYIKNVCVKHNTKLVVKAKSITSEEIQLNSVLEKEGIEVAETDLAEFILQVSGEQPSHNVAPAIHRSRERITELFKENFDTPESLDTGEELTKFARDILRKKFLSADVGISGANLIAADSGTILLVESEGNIRLTTQLPAVHIAISGIEKIIQRREDIGTFIELLAASATGQSLTTYTNILTPPLDLPILNLNGRNDEKREFHLVLVDNGRMQMRNDNDFKEALYCIRCSACMNVCANFQAVGGHAFGGESYVGGIGGAWTVFTSGKLEDARFAELCTGCSRCVPNCPVKIDIPNLNTIIKDRLIKAEGSASLQKKFFGNFSSLAKMSSHFPAISNWISDLDMSRLLLEKTVGLDKRRPISKIADKTLESLYRNYRKKNKSINTDQIKFKDRTILFADVFTNYEHPQAGIATIKVFDKIGISIELSKVMDDGRALQSQGMLDEAKVKAKDTAEYLRKLIDNGNRIIVVEPSVLAMLRRDYEKLIDDEELFKKISENSYDPVEYLNLLFDQNKYNNKDVFLIPRTINKNIFMHNQCQMKTIGADQKNIEFFEMLGFNVITSDVECCGMAGSFGYKKEYYDLSKNIGNELIKQINENAKHEGEFTILASGTSCRAQISDGMKEKNVTHPIEFIESLLKLK
ncbi:Predicted L-lactate dehydrogenase, Iron-sulfur cluster-binding subunit YkgF [hydrothermal vent metagenome]|uniref:Predicted L-lactate dehydrogenase, Iron-sulfur cluster-binding subunit YkgF n=1 Tax=hydrothermal vent metagenome TaxID=652676 RepID=A0A3B1CGQ0_9ZZZZ